MFPVWKSKRWIQNPLSLHLKAQYKLGYDSQARKKLPPRYWETIQLIKIMSENEGQVVDVKIVV